jgi:hypothetical protein
MVILFPLISNFTTRSEGSLYSKRLAGIRNLLGGCREISGNQFEEMQLFIMGARKALASSSICLFI